MILEWLFFIVLTIVPFVELRLSIPVGILTGSIPLFFDLQLSGLGFNPYLVFIVAVITNSLLGFVVYDALQHLDKRLRKSDMNYWYTRFLDNAHEKLQPFVKRFGLFGVALFIALPIPGSGVYIGSVGSHVLGLSRSAFRKACVLGVFMAASFVTVLVVTGQSLFSYFF